tara:strand:+ start:25 stop:429 length:405 start_codon:yes stop_codon:yes gene_type:complete
MATSKVKKTRNNKQWTEARYRAFIRSALRSAWSRWGPNHTTKKNARVGYGQYQCVGYDAEPHIVGASVVIDGKRKNNIFTDHIEPVGGDGDWNRVIENLFCETDNLQLLCKECHDEKSKNERAIAREIRKGYNG